MSAPGALLAGRYRLISMIAAGGMGVVWKGWDERLGRTVAVKQLRPSPGVPEAEVELAKDRAMREARITGRLQHTHAVPVLDAVEHEGQPCLVMPFLESVTLSAVLRDGPLPLSRVTRIGAEVASALAAAHRLGIVHRDVKPGNILITPDGAAHISDFGISHALGDVTLTGTGWIHGTPAYLAPEMARGEAAAYPSDVFSLGATLYAALEGRPPFGTDTNAIALLHRVAAGRVPPPERAGSLTAFLLEMLSSEPRSRPTMDVVAAVLADHAVYVEVEELGPDASAEWTAGSAAPLTQGGPADGLSSWFPAQAATPASSAGQAAGTGTTAEHDVTPAEAVQDPVAARVPHGHHRPGRARPSRAVVLAGVALVVMLLALGAAALLSDLGGPPPTVAGRAPAPTTPVDSASGPDASKGSASAPEGTSAPASASQPSASTSATQGSASASDRSSAPESVTQPAPLPAASAEPEPSVEETEPPPPPEQATELAFAITDYYALMPGNTGEGWTRMTADYQTNHAGGFDSYDRFWSEIVDVSVSEVQATPPDGVVATLTYSFADGRVAVERTAYRLVDEGGVLKIAASEVLSSRTG